MMAYLDEPFSIGYAWDDGPTDHFSTKEQAVAAAKKWRENNPESAPIYVFHLLEVV